MEFNLESKYFNENYGKNPDFYLISFWHYNIELLDESKKEYELIESDLKKIQKETKDLFKIYFSNTDDLLKMIENTNMLNDYFENIYLRINSVDDLIKLSKYNELFNLNIIVLDSELLNYKNTNINDYNIILQIDTVNELKPIELEKIKLDYNINEIIVGQISTGNYSLDFYKKIANKFNLNYMDYLRIEKQVMIYNDNYKVDEYVNIYNELLKLVSDIDLDDLEINKFKIVYDRVIKKIYYDYEGVKDTKLNNQNLIGGLFYNKCVCEGYSKILQQALSLVGIESIVVGGGGSKEIDGHIWNQVKIDGIWYNVDATYDSIQIHNNKEIELCLVDDDYLYYKTYYLIAKKCPTKYKFKERK